MGNLVTPYYLSIFKDNQKTIKDFDEYTRENLEFFGFSNVEEMRINEPNFHYKFMRTLYAFTIALNIAYQLDNLATTDIERLLYRFR